MPQEVFDSFPPNLCGGLPGRGIDDLIATPMLHLEHTICAERASGSEVDAFQLLALDAVKCLDKINWMTAIIAGLQVCIPPRLTAVLASLLASTLSPLLCGRLPRPPTLCALAMGYLKAAP